MYTRSSMDLISDSLLKFFMDKENLLTWEDVSILISKSGIKNLHEATILPDIFLEEYFRRNEFLVRMITHFKIHHHYLIKIALKDIYYTHKIPTCEQL